MVDHINTKPSRAELSFFKSKQLLLLRELEKELTVKYSSNPNELNEVLKIVETLRNKLRYLRSNMLFNYLYTLMDISRKYPEFSKLLPSSADIPD